MNGELLRLVDALHREKDIEKEILFEAIEGAINSAIKKRHNPLGEIEVQIDRMSGSIAIFEEGTAVEYPDMGRIQAQTAKQVIIQKIREAERDVIYSEYEDRVGTIVNGNVQRIEGGNVIVNLGRAEGILPKAEKIRGENYQPGDRIKALIQEVKKVGQKVRIVLTRASPDLVVRLFELEVPEIGEKIIEIKRIAREPGYRTKIAVSSYDMRVDCIGACVGIRGSRIKSITDELNDEKIDIIRWNESAEVLIINSLKPAQIHSMSLDEEEKIAHVLVPDDMLSLAIGRKGQNVRLATKLTGWEIKIGSLAKAMKASSENEEEDPEVAGVREALLQGTGFENKATAGSAEEAKAEGGDETAVEEEETSEPEVSAEEEGSAQSEGAEADTAPADEETTDGETSDEDTADEAAESAEGEEEAPEEAAEAEADPTPAALQVPDDSVSTGSENENQSEMGNTKED
ncbi:MAG: transcription termination factor NusA [Planctomycetota bacterium]|jgi:N utilization substance protein A